MKMMYKYIAKTGGNLPPSARPKAAAAQAPTSTEPTPTRDKHMRDDKPRGGWVGQQKQCARSPVRLEGLSDLSQLAPASSLIGKVKSTCTHRVRDEWLLPNSRALLPNLEPSSDWFAPREGIPTGSFLP